MTGPEDVAGIRRMSRRLGLQAGLLLVGCLLVVGTLLYVTTERAADAAADQQLVDVTTNIDAPGEAPLGVEVVVVTPNGRRTSPGMPDGLPDEAALAATQRDGRTREDEIRVGEHRYAVRTAKVGDRVTQAVADRHERDEERARLLAALLVAGAVGVLLAGLVAAWLARRTLQPMAATIGLQRRFVADASHELRTPLTLLSTRAQLLARRLRREAGVQDELISDVDGVVADAKVLTQILEELLVAADTRTAADTEPIEVDQLVTACVSAASATAQTAGIELVATPGATPASVDGNASSLRRAVTALIDNAMDHAHRRVEVSVERGARDVVVRVLDDGRGIAADVAPHLFERFASSRPERPGMRRHYGIGLALVADVAAAHHGNVSAGARDDGEPGAQLTLSLPARS